MMGRRIKHRGLVTLRTQRVSFGDKLVAVGIVAIRAHHARLVHFALYERPIYIDLVPYLPIGPVKWIFDQRKTVGV
jgi:hypothetical protein